MASAFAAPRTAQQAARTAQEVVQSGVGTISEVAQRTTGQMVEVADVARQRNQNLTERASKNLHALTEAGSALARGVQDISSECIGMAQERLQKNLDGVNELVRCRTIPEFVAAQTSLIRENLELTLENGRRLAELSTRFVQEASRPVASHADRKTSRAA